MEFEITSGRVHISDPCYDTSPNETDNVPAKNGVWCSSVDYGIEGRVASIRVWHKDCPSPYCDKSFSYGVDSGQLGIFDASIYDSNSEYGESGFYNDCCEATLSPERVGVVQGKGFVSSTGYGDGCYEGYSSFHNGELIAFTVEFISQDEDWDDDDWEDEDFGDDE